MDVKAQEEKDEPLGDIPVRRRPQPSAARPSASGVTEAA